VFTEYDNFCIHALFIVAERPHVVNFATAFKKPQAAR